MEPLTWTGPLGQFLDPALYLLSAVFLVAVVVQIVLGIATGGSRVVTNPDGTLSSAGGAYDLSANATRWLGLGLLVVVLAYVVIGIFGGPQVARDHWRNEPTTDTGVDRPDPDIRPVDQVQAEAGSLWQTLRLNRGNDRFRACDVLGLRRDHGRVVRLDRDA